MTSKHYERDFAVSILDEPNSKPKNQSFSIKSVK